MYISPKTSVTMRASSYCHYRIQIDFNFRIRSSQKDIHVYIDRPNFLTNMDKLRLFSIDL